MRITFQGQYSNYIRDLGRAETAMFDAQDKVSSGKRINRLGDDPVGLSQTLSMRTLRGGLEQYGANLQSAKGQLGFSDASLAEAQKLVRRGYELAVSGANSSTSQEARQAMVSEIQQIQNRLVDIGNAQGPRGGFIFAGQKTDTKPFAVGASGLVYSGDGADVLVEVSPTDTMVVNTQGEKLFTNAYKALDSLKSDLLGGDLTRIGSIDLAELQTTDKAFGLARSEVGAKTRSVEEQMTHHTRRSDELSSQISDIEDVNLAEAIVNYSQAQNAYQAALQSVSLSSRLSLVDFMR